MKSLKLAPHLYHPHHPHHHSPHMPRSNQSSSFSSCSSTPSASSFCTYSSYSSSPPFAFSSSPPSRSRAPRTHAPPAPNSFFALAAASRPDCDAHARHLLARSTTSVMSTSKPVPVVPVHEQGARTYTVYVGWEREVVVSFRLARIDLKATDTARKIWGPGLVPAVSYQGRFVGESAGAGAGSGCGCARGRPVHVYMAARVAGINFFDFRQRQTVLSVNSREWCRWRLQLVEDLARSIYAPAYAHPIPLSASSASSHRASIRARAESDLSVLLGALPARFAPVLRRAIATLPAICASLPLTLVHRGAFERSVHVNGRCNVVGITNWEDGAEVGLLGAGLAEVQRLMGRVDDGDQSPDTIADTPADSVSSLACTSADPTTTTAKSSTGAIVPFVDHDELEDAFWEVLCAETGLIEGNAHLADLIKMSRLVDTLIQYGFLSAKDKDRPHGPGRVPVSDASLEGRCKLRRLDDLLLNPRTRYPELD